MSYLQGSPRDGGLGAVEPHTHKCRCSLGADETQRSPVVLVAALAGLVAGILWSKRGARR